MPSLEDVTVATPLATDAYNRAVTVQMVGDVSPDQRAFLASMVRHGAPTRIGDIRADNGWSSPQANVYRQRLIDIGLVVAETRGFVDFAVPGVEDVLSDDL